MSLSWNEIKTRAAAFVNEWKDIAPTAREEADAPTFELYRKAVINQKGNHLYE